MDRDFEDWQPPTEAEMKLMQARRDRSDRISKLMGDYLLKGYKMLGSNCAQCDTILLQTKQGVNYCVACSELASDADKDNPVTNHAAALALARENEVRDGVSSPQRSVSSSTQQQLPLTSSLSPQLPITSILREHDISSSGILAPNLPAFRPQGVNVNASAYAASSGVAGSLPRPGDSQKYVGELLNKMDWAVEELRSTRSVEYSTQLCQLVKSCADAVGSVRTAFDS